MTNSVLIVNNGNCGRLLQELEIARPAELSIRKRRGELAVKDGAHPSGKPVCINRRIARERGCVFSCVRRLRPRKRSQVPTPMATPRTSLPASQANRTRTATRNSLPAIPATHQDPRRFLGASNQR